MLSEQLLNNEIEVHNNYSDIHIVCCTLFSIVFIGLIITLIFML